MIFFPIQAMRSDSEESYWWDR